MGSIDLFFMEYFYVIQLLTLGYTPLVAMCDELGLYVLEGYFLESCYLRYSYILLFS